MSDAFKMCSWFLIKEYLKTGKNARQQEKYSAGFQVPLSFLRDSTLKLQVKRGRLKLAELGAIVTRLVDDAMEYYPDEKAGPC